MNKKNNLSMFLDIYVEEAIDRIKRFEKLADAMGYEIAVGFSGGKDSQVVYDLCVKAGVKFKAYYNESFESPTTKKFIKENYPDVIWRKTVNCGFIANIWKNHGGLLPTVEIAYCCKDYKHNPKFVDDCSVTGVRASESSKRKERKTLSIKNKTTLKKNKEEVSKLFEDKCHSLGAVSKITLNPIIDWKSIDVWSYIRENNLPINPEYKDFERVGCIFCPKTSFNKNFYYLYKYPRLIDAFIIAREKGHLNINWRINNDNKDYTEDKPYYICRWLSYSFRPFSKKEQILYKKLREKYNEIKSKDE